DDISVQPVCHLRAGGGASQLVKFVSGERLGLDDERGEELRFDVAGVPEIDCEFVISLDLLGHRADVAKFHAELVVGRAGLRVVGTPSVVAEGLKPCEDFIDGHADDYTRDSKQANHDRRSLQVGCVCCRGMAAMKSSSSGNLPGRIVFEASKSKMAARWGERERRVPWVGPGQYGRLPARQ